MGKLKTAKEIAFKAGKAIISIYETDFGAEDKIEDGRTSPLTKADLMANDIIMKALKEAFPNNGFLTEEDADDKGRLSKEYVWIIDPLDGTKEFIKRNGEFTVNIGLVKKGNPVLGVIYVPAKGDLYYASEGEGAFHEKEGEKHRISVSERDDLRQMVIIKSRSHASPQELKIIEDVGFADVKTSGSSVKGCMVAKGEADIYYRFGRTMEWDICAMHCIIKEAGGKMTDLQGKNINYNKDDPEILGFIASNGCAHERLVEVAGEND